MQGIGVFTALLFGMLFFGSGTPTAKIVTEGFPIFLAPFLRLLLAALLTTPLLIIYRRELRGISQRNWLLIGGIGLVAFSLFLLSGLLVSYVWLGEAFHWIHLVGFALVLAAIALVAWAHQHGKAAAGAKGKAFKSSTVYPC